MEVLILHLSDSHFTENFFMSMGELTKKILDSLKGVNTFRRCLILFSGDMSHSSKIEEFKQVKDFLAQLESKILNEFDQRITVSTLFVPGNHDIDFTDKPISREEIVQKLKTNETDELTKSYLSKMGNFYSLAKQHKIYIEDDFIDIKYIEILSYKIGVVLVNSALFSLFRDSNSDNDRGLHYIPQPSLKRLEDYTKCDINILVTHHAPKFFNEKSEHIIESFIESNIDMVFFGHEHSNNNKEVTKDNSVKTYYFSGGPLYENGSSIFNSYLFCFDTCQLMRNKHVYTTDYYQVIKDNTPFILNIKSNNYIRCEYIKEIQKSENNLNGESLRDYFVFPDISNKSNIESEKKPIKDMHEFLKKTLNKQVISIEGSNGCGKTALAKMLFIELSKNKYPIFISADQLTPKNLEKSINNAYTDIYYDDKLHYGKYLQKNIDEKVLIIDDYHKVPENRIIEILEKLQETFSQIYMFASNSHNLNLLETVKKEYAIRQTSVSYEIKDLYHNKRIELISKLIHNRRKELTKEEVAKISKDIERTISNQINIMNLTPEFIMLFVNTYMMNGIQVGSSNIFNSIFTSNITLILKKRFDNASDISAIILLLQNIAFIAHISKEYPIKQSSIIKLIEEHNKRARNLRTPINGSNLIKELVDIRLLRYCNDEGDIVFSSINYFSYFIAKEIINKYIKQIDNVNDIIQKTIDNICFGINSDILLFLCYLSDNENILLQITKKADMFFNGWIELDLNKFNLPFLLKSKEKQIINLPTKKEKEEAIEIIEKQEEEISKKNTGFDIYDYNEDSINEYSSKLLCGIKYIEIISKMLPDFIYLLDDDGISKFIKGIYEYPNRLLYSALKPFDIIRNLEKKEYDKLLFSNTTIDYYIEQSDFIKEISRASWTLILNIYNLVARLSAQKTTLRAIESYPYKKSITHSLINSMVYENMGDTEDMGKRLEFIDKNAKNDVITENIKKIIKKHYIHNSIRYFGYNQHLIDKYLPTEKKNTMVSLKKIKR